MTAAARLGARGSDRGWRPVGYAKREQRPPFRPAGVERDERAKGYAHDRALRWCEEDCGNGARRARELMRVIARGSRERHCRQCGKRSHRELNEECGDMARTKDGGHRRMNDPREALLGELRRQQRGDLHGRDPQRRAARPHRADVF